MVGNSACVKVFPTSDWTRAHVCTREENHVCFGSIRGSQLREGANEGQHTPSYTYAPSPHHGLPQRRGLPRESPPQQAWTRTRAGITPLSATSWGDGPLVTAQGRAMADVQLLRLRLGVPCVMPPAVALQPRRPTSKCLGRERCRTRGRGKSRRPPTADSGRHRRTHPLWR